METVKNDRKFFYSLFFNDKAERIKMEQTENTNHTPTTAFAPQRKKRRGGNGIIIFIWIVSIVLTATIAATVTALYSRIAAEKKYREENGHLLQSVRQARDVIRDYGFYYTEDETKLTEAALKGLASATGDTYATYYTSEEYAELLKQNERAFVGIGILTQINDDGAVEILEVYDDTPAKEQGLQPGDVILEINGAAYDGEELGTFLSNVRAENGAENTFVILRGTEQKTFVLTAREVHTPAVSYRMLTETVGYIHIISFHGACVEETRNALDVLLKSGIKELVLDLRDNLGGSLKDAIDVADLFLPKNHIVTTLRSRTGHVTEYKTQNSGIDLKTVILVNEMTASASELVAGAMKDYEAAYLIGTLTYGKGIVQSFYKIEETEGWLKLTTDAYFTPNGVCVQDEGITPDLIVELPEEAKRFSIEHIPGELDTQLTAAIRYLEEN